MPLSVGTRLGPYEILAQIGAGGMGEVYKARDARLNRIVAIKVSQAQFSERFENEARAVAALNHPHICTLFDVGPNYLVMEFVEGAPLKGPLPIERAVEYAGQILDALDAAHQRGITHRDLKPDNILVAKNGIKLLDFGLAKQTTALREEDATLTQALTGQGQILGTWQYMSPEQLQGKPADSRSDLFSFGCILYETLTGTRAFKGSSAASVIAAILEREPAPFITAPPLERILKRCLAKDPDQRFQTARDLKAALSWALEASPAPPASYSSQNSGKLPWVVAGALAIGLAAIAFLHFREKPPSPAVPVRFQIPAPENTTLGPLLNISPDGSKVAFIAAGHLWVHFLESGESRDLVPASGSPVWSPDSRFIAYPYHAKLQKIEATGGVPQKITDLTVGWLGGAWNQDDVIVFSDAQLGLFRISAGGGTPVHLTAPSPSRPESHSRPSFLPDGRHFIYHRSGIDEAGSVYIGSIDAKPEQQGRTPLLKTRLAPVYVPSEDANVGYLLFLRDATLMAQPFDNRRLRLTGEAQVVADHIGDNGGIYGGFSVSKNNVLVFWPSGSDVQLTWYDRLGNTLAKVGVPGNYESVAISPDGKHAVAGKRVEGTSNVMLFDLSPGGTTTRFSGGADNDVAPIYSPDGRSIVFSSRDGIYKKAVNGTKDAELLLKSGEFAQPATWTHDGRFLIYNTSSKETKLDIWVLPLEGDRKPFPFLATPFREFAGSVSSDGRWIAYTSDESGRNEVYVRSFAINSASTGVELGPKWQVSERGGYGGGWSADEREFFYQSYDVPFTPMALDISNGPPFHAGKPRPIEVPSRGIWDVSPDGKRLLVASPISEKPAPYTVILNWQSGLKR